MAVNNRVFRGLALVVVFGLVLFSRLCYSEVGHASKGYLDSVILSDGRVVASGWLGCIDDCGAFDIEVLVNGTRLAKGSVKPQSRPDVAEAFTNEGWRQSGWLLDVSGIELPTAAGALSANAIMANGEVFPLEIADSVRPYSPPYRGKANPRVLAAIGGFLLLVLGAVILVARRRADLGVAFDKRLVLTTGAALMLGVGAWSAVRLASDSSGGMVLKVRADFDRAEEIQLFLDSGAGFTGGGSMASVGVPGRAKVVHFELPRTAYRGVRLDPAKGGPTKILIRAIWAEFNGNKTYVPLKDLHPSDDIHTRLTPEGFLEVTIPADAKDPSLLFEGMTLTADGNAASSAIFLLKQIGGLLCILAAWYLLWRIAAATDDYVVVSIGWGLVCVALLMLRNFDPISSSVLYTEDASWTGLIIDKGTLGAIWSARSDYLVVGNVLLLWLGLGVNHALFGYDIGGLPVIYAVISYIFYAGVGTFVALSFAGKMSSSLRAALCLSLVLMPLGFTSNEVFGRLSNVGFLLALVTVRLAALRGECRRRWLVDGLIILCILTNPLCVASLATWVFVSGYGSEAGKGWFFREVMSWKWVLVAAVVYSLLLAYRYSLGGHDSGLSEGFVPAHAFETIAARSILFPWLSSVYESLSDTLVLAVGLTALIVLWRCFLAAEGQDRKDLVAMWASAGVVIMLSVVMRKGLTGWIGGYTGTFPDRYFICQNAFVLTAFWFSIAQLLRKSFRRASEIALFAFLVAPLVASGVAVFEFATPRYPIMSDGTLAEGVRREYLLNPSSATYRVEQYFRGFGIALPKRYVEATAGAMAK